MSLFELKIAMRYIKGKKGKNGFISFISFMSMLGIIIGVAALIIVCSLLNGFKYKTVDNVLLRYAHINLKKDLNEEQINMLSKYSKENSEIKQFSANIVNYGFMLKNDIAIPVTLVGLDSKMSEFKIISTKKVIDFEKIKLENFDVLISSEYENMYKVGNSIIIICADS